MWRFIASTGAAAVLLATTVHAQIAAYQQCGGPNWTGTTACVAGYYCSYQSQYYSQCVPGTGSSSVAVSATTLKTSTTSGVKTSTAVSTTTLKTSTTSGTQTSTAVYSSATDPAPTGSGKFKFFGINESGAEFGQAAYPGVWGTHFIFPSNAAISTLIAEGYNTFRVAFAMERLAPSGMAAAFSPAYLGNLTATIQHITDSGAWAVLDPHNFGRYNGAVITDVEAFKTFWVTLASAFKNDSKVIFDTNNEYHDMDSTLVLNLNQAAINGIRSTGATSQYIFVEGNSYSGAWTWPSANDNLKALTDPQDKLVYQMHQYLDADGSGTSEVCVSATIGAERVASATNWLRENGKVGIIGEFAGGANAVCRTAVQGLVEHLKANQDVWTGALWWGGGPWWGNYLFGFEPPSSVGYNYYDSMLKTYAPGL